MKIFNTYRSLLLEISIKAAWDSFYSDKNKYPALNGNEQLFNALNDLYPKKGDQFNKGAFMWLYKLVKGNKLKEEDFYKVKEYLDYFYKYTNKIPADKRDLMRFNSLPELYDVIKPFINPEGGEAVATSKSQELKQIKEKEIKKVYEDNRWLIAIPLTERGSCIIGAGTQWCTAAKEAQNYFDHYNNQGPLYVLIDKDEDRKYQLHFETGSLMDERDHPVSGCWFFENELSSGAEEFLQGASEKFWEFIIESSVDDEGRSSSYCELLHRALENAKDTSIVEKALRSLRGSDDEDSIYTGFMYEKEAGNIDKYDIEGLLDKHLDPESLSRIIEHLNEIGFDFDLEDAEESIKVYLRGLQQLKDHNLKMNREYKIDKDRILRIEGIEYSGPEPRYKIRIEFKSGTVDLETLLNLLHNRSLFEGK